MTYSSLYNLYMYTNWQVFFRCRSYMVRRAYSFPLKIGLPLKIFPLHRMRISTYEHYFFPTLPQPISPYKPSFPLQKSTFPLRNQVFPYKFIDQSFKPFQDSRRASEIPRQIYEICQNNFRFIKSPTFPYGRSVFSSIFPYRRPFSP